MSADFRSRAFRRRKVYLRSSSASWAWPSSPRPILFSANPSPPDCLQKRQPGQHGTTLSRHTAPIGRRPGNGWESVRIPGALASRPQVSWRWKTCRKCGSSGIIVDGEGCREIVERYLENGKRASIPPLREGGAARRKMACGLRVRSGGKGRRGEYCGWPSRHASAWIIHKGLEFLLPVESRACRDGIPQYSPRRGPAACLFPVIDVPSMAAPPPSRRGECPGAFLVPCIRGIPEVVPP